MQEKKEFNQLKYIQKYQEEHYKVFKAKLKPDEYNVIDEYMKKNKLNKSTFLRKAIEVLKKAEKEE